MANPRIEELPDEAETTGPKKAEAEDASDSSGSEVEGGEGGEGKHFVACQRFKF